MKKTLMLSKISPINKVRKLKRKEKTITILKGKNGVIFMRIDAYNTVNQVTTPTRTKKPVNTNRTTSTSDKVEISQTGRDFQVAMQAAKESPDIRQDRVDEIKARLQAGTYDVSDEDLAEKLLSKFMTK